ncbi:PREDICTED: protein FAR1-RELATED SEQUENCE 5-like [Ipomoea nil]|uniref:protein FAR1-RELATED SEQUENCE 5-like n=1 Tax=Ipomoea nil TaxID=35883 RepID=UPI00090194E8|nr:PREDICTED: protein FAR1-RELATED SEQUENCE 5-like [Ipomoea nil]
MVGGVANVGATKQDFKNYKREMLEFMREGDAQMVISKYLAKKADDKNMFFEYEMNEQDNLARLFWADGVARKNYGAFGDVVSFDATYQTNRYKLVFVPFTGVDNHKRCVTFGVGMIDREDVESYRWILQKFKDAMGSIPPLTVTDQDPAMKVAIATEFPRTQHRYCMWHIMTKVGDKVGTEMAQNGEFRRALNAVVWNEKSTIDEFESTWDAVIGKYGLSDNRWLKRMYEDRASWVPAFFDNVFMAGLLRTTSRSESENRVFQRNSNKHLCLVDFWNRFETAVKTQRNTHLELSAACEGQTPPLKTSLRIEREAASGYTLKVFYEVQEEIYAGCYTCRVRSITEDETSKTYVVVDGNKETYTVILEYGSNTTTCTCRLYTRIGLLCRHVFVVLKNEQIIQIPPQHITPRWTREAGIYTNPDTTNEREEGEESTPQNNKDESNLINAFYKYLAMARGRADKLRQLTDVIEDFQGQMREDGQEGSTVNGKQAVMETYCGVPAPNTIVVHLPTVANTKGSGKRMKSVKELAMAEQVKKKRTCKTCGLETGHNSRSCSQKQ